MGEKGKGFINMQMALDFIDLSQPEAAATVTAAAGTVFRFPLFHNSAALAYRVE